MTNQTRSIYVGLTQNGKNPFVCRCGQMVEYERCKKQIQQSAVTEKTHIAIAQQCQ